MNTSPIRQYVKGLENGRPFNIVNIKEYRVKGDGSTDDITAINNGISENAGNLIYFPEGTYNISQAIKIPDDTIIFLNNCTIYLMDDSNDNIFRNDDIDNGNSNIYIYGRGNARLDGNAKNQDRDVYGTKNNESYRYTGVFLCQVNGFEINGIKIGPTHAWGICHQKCSNGEFKNIEFMQNEDTDNQDGITCGGGAENIKFSNIYGYTGDDHIALNTHDNQDFVYPSIGAGDIKNININGLEVQNFRAIRLLTGDGYQLKDITIKNIKVTGPVNTVVTFGEESYVDTSPEENDFTNIKISDISFGENAEITEKVIDLSSTTGKVNISNIDFITSEYNKTEYDDLAFISIDRDIKELIINNLNINYDKETDATNGNIISTEDITIKNLIINDCYFDLLDNNFLEGFSSINSGSINNIFFKKCRHIFNNRGSSNWDISVKNISIQSRSDISQIFPNSTNGIKIEGHFPPIYDEDSKPEHIIGSKVLAHPSWDPDNDGNGELVISDGSDWKEIVDMPDWT